MGPTLHIDDHGAGACVVLLHGTGQPPTAFATLAGTLAAAEYRVLVPHYPGYGLTPSWPRDQLAEFVPALEAQLGAMGVGVATLVGCSRGTYAALALAQRGRLGVSSMVLLAAVAGFDADDALRYRALADAIRTDISQLRPAWLSLMAGPNLPARKPEKAAELMRWFDNLNATAVADELLTFADIPDLRPFLAQLTCPALVCVGNQDNGMPAAWSEDAASRLPNARLVHFDGAGHSLLLEREAEVIAAIAQHLSSSLRT